MSKRPRGRQRRHDNAWLPPKVWKDKSGYFYYDRKTKEYHRLGKLDAPRSAIWAAYDDLHRSSAITVASVIDAYLKSPQYTQLKPATQRDYLQYSRRVIAVFGAMEPDAITSPHVQLFMDARGEKHPTAANHEKSFLSLVLNWGKARAYMRGANPCDAVRNIRTTPGGRYVDVEDYFGFYNFLIDRGHVMHAVAMEIAYLCGARQQDVLRILRAPPGRPSPEDCYVCDRGILIAQGKTGKTQLKLWTPRLQAAVDLANTQTFKIESRYLLRGRTGDPFTRTGFNSTWIRRQKEAEEAGVISARFRFHDTKVSAISDYTEGDKQHFSGHKTRSQVDRYNRKPDEVATISGHKKPAT